MAKGNPPPENRGWRYVLDFNHGRVKWTLYARQKARDEAKGWLNLKIVANYRLRKANYWLNWNGERFGRQRDAQTLQDCYPSLDERLRAVLASADPVLRHTLAFAGVETVEEIPHA